MKRSVILDIIAMQRAIAEHNLRMMFRIYILQSSGDETDLKCHSNLK